MNDGIGHYFQTLKGFRKGDLLCPILFNIVVDMLDVLIARAKEDDQVGALIPSLIDRVVSMLQYANNTIHVWEYGLEKVVNMKLISSMFEGYIALARLRKGKMSNFKSLDARWVHYHSNI